LGVSIVTDWLPYWTFVLGPFVQEDAAVVGAATFATMAGKSPVAAFGAVLSGLILSDVWKYWAGRLARTHRFAKKFAEKPGVMAARDNVVNRLGVTLMTARFVPGTRIPLYVASGFFNAPFHRFFLYMSASAVLYVSIVFTAFYALGAVAGEAAKDYLPLVGVVMVATILSITLLRSRGRRRQAAAVAAAAAIEPMALAAANDGSAPPERPAAVEASLSARPAPAADVAR